MEHIGAGLAALGVIGPGIGIGILGGLAASAIGRNPDAAGQIRGIALFVGLVELMLEFVKPVTLSMRLFGNIYGGEVALGVITALTIAFSMTSRPSRPTGMNAMVSAVMTPSATSPP